MARMISEDQLDPQQRAFLEKMETDQRNSWIKGFAGSGKSVLLVYTAKRILQRNPNAKVILVVFTLSLVDMYNEDFEGFRTELKINIPIVTYLSFKKGTESYDYILCDEAQDLTPSVLSDMRKRGTRVIVAGDSNQSIYPCAPYYPFEPTVEPEQIGEIVNADSFELGIIHRLTHSIISAVNHLLPKMEIFKAKKDMTKSDVDIRLYRAESSLFEVKYVMELAESAVNRSYSSAVLLPTHNAIICFANYVLSNAGKPRWTTVLNRFQKPDFGDLNKHLEQYGVNIQVIGNGYGHFSDLSSKVTLMTYHSSKGLDFEAVYIPFACRDMYICSDEELAKTLFMVAMTRSRKNLYITYNGVPSTYVTSFRENCREVVDTHANASNSVDFGF